MRKQNNADPKDYQFLIAKYRWEFLRRNKQYIKDYHSGKRYPNKHWVKEYDIYPPFDPSDDFPKSLKDQRNMPLYDELSPLPPIVIQSISHSPITGKEVAQEKFTLPPRLKKENLQKISTLTLLVDITHRERLILSEFKKLISYWKNIRKTTLKIRLTQYKRYLQIYNLKEKRWSWTRLANRFHPDDKGGIDYAKQKVMLDYKRCKKLINGGYKQIK